MSKEVTQPDGSSDHDQGTSERKLGSQLLVLGEKVAIMGDQDAVTAEVIDGQHPCVVVCDGVGDYSKSGQYAQWLATQAMSEVSQALSRLESNGHVEASLRTIFDKLKIDSSKELEKHQGQAASTIMVCFLFRPKTSSEKPQWWFAGVGNGQILLSRADSVEIHAFNQVMKGRDPDTGLPTEITNSFPATTHAPVVIDSAEYQAGDELVCLTDGFDWLLHFVNRNNLDLNQVIKGLLAPVSNNEDMKQALGLTGWGQQLPSLPRRPFSDDATAAVIKTHHP